MRSNQFFLRFITGAAGAALIAGCVHEAQPLAQTVEPEPAPVMLEPRERTETNSYVTISRNASGDYDFRYSGEEVTPKGNFNFKEGDGRNKEMDHGSNC